MALRSPQALIDLYESDVVRVHGDNVTLTPDFKSHLSEKIQAWRDQGFRTDDGPAVVQAIQAVFPNATKDQVFAYLNIIVPLIKIEMLGKFVRKDRERLKWL